ncbi:hypothetical protein F4810DRAFT_711515 [Camillea tinctor]|nr:hypothetical protein F4810DRAFT_711515 [Camillea tinctor]
MTNGDEISRELRNDRPQRTNLDNYFDPGIPTSSSFVLGQGSHNATSHTLGPRHNRTLSDFHQLMGNTTGVNGYSNERGLDARHNVPQNVHVSPRKEKMTDTTWTDSSLAAFFELSQHDSIDVAIRAKDRSPFTITAKIDKGFQHIYCTGNKGRELTSLTGIKPRSIPEAKQKPHLTPFGEMTPKEYIQAHIGVTSIRQ